MGGRLPHRAGKGLVIPCKGKDIELMKHPHPERVYTVSFSGGGGGGGGGGYKRDSADVSPLQERDSTDGSISREGIVFPFQGPEKSRFSKPPLSPF